MQPVPCSSSLSLMKRPLVRSLGPKPGCGSSGDHHVRSLQSTNHASQLVWGHGTADFWFDPSWGASLVWTPWRVQNDPNRSSRIQTKSPKLLTSRAQWIVFGSRGQIRAQPPTTPPGGHQQVTCDSWGRRVAGRSFYWESLLGDHSLIPHQSKTPPAAHRAQLLTAPFTRSSVGSLARSCPVRSFSHTGWPVRWSAVATQWSRFLDLTSWTRFGSLEEEPGGGEMWSAESWSHPKEKKETTHT